MAQMLNAQQMMMHPIWNHFRTRLNACVTTMMQRGMMMPQEAQQIQLMLQQIGPGTQNFINSLMMRYQSIDDAAMDAEIMNNFLPSIRQAAQQRAMMGGGGMPMGGGGMMMPGMMGGYQQPMRPMGFGYDPQFQRGGGMVAGGVTPITKPDPFVAPGGPTSVGADLFGGAKPNLAPDPKPATTNKPIPYSTPLLGESNDVTVAGCVRVQIGKYKLGDGSTARRVAVYDPRIRYANDYDALNAYKSAFNLYREKGKKFLTVLYKQLKVVNVGREEFVKMATAISGEVLKNGGSLEAKLRAIINTLGSFSVNSVNEFTRIFLDELDDYMQSGALCDSVHPKNIMNRFDSIQAVLDLVSGDIDKNMLDALKSMEGFEDKLNKIVGHIVDDTVAHLPKYILDPSKDRNVLDDYTRALPQIWSADGGNTISGTEDLFDIFLKTKETIDTSRTDGAVKAESTLAAKLDSLHRQFTLIYVPRVASWCNIPKSVAVSYDEKGNCVPYVADINQVSNDLAFFCAEVLATSVTSSASLMKWGQKSVYCECDEETFCLQYGFTTDNKMWIGSSKYWK